MKIFPPWQPNLDSRLLKKCMEIYQALHSVKPSAHLTHGGLDTIAFGCMIENLYSPDERLLIPSLPKIWEVMKSLLAAM